MSELLDNRAHRIRTMKEVIRHLHEGRAPAEVKERLAALVGECDASEIAAMEQELLAEGVPAQEIMGMCDLHAQVVRDIVADEGTAPPPPGHPVDTFHRENEALGVQAASLRSALGALTPERRGDDAGVDPAGLLACRGLFSGLMDVEKHYLRKEHLLFSCLERHGITGPSTVMWGKDDEARGLLKNLGLALAKSGGSVAECQLLATTVAEPALHAVEEMIFKEERILLPMALQNLTETEWGEIFTQSPQFGYCLVDPRAGYEPPAAASDVPEAASAEAARSGIAFAPFAAGARAVPLAMAGAPVRAAGLPQAMSKGLVVLPTGVLSLDQLKAVFATLPVDITFVDADDRVRFFSEGNDRVFARPKAILGRLVQHCHPPGSVERVERILSDFRGGRQNVAEFWLNFNGRFVHVRYFALRDAKGTYLGTLEVTQDLTRERTLEGERRLLQYDS